MELCDKYNIIIHLSTRINEARKALDKPCNDILHRTHIVLKVPENRRIRE